MASTEILDKIRQLKLLAQSSNLNEALSASAIADKLILKYRISEQELLQSGIGQEETPDEDSFILYETARVIRWKGSLATNIARHYGCIVWNDCFHDPERNGRQVSRYRLVGRKSDREIVSFMFAWLVLEIERLTKLNCKGQGHVACNSYSEGATVGVAQQLHKDKEEIKKEAASSNALVKLDERYEESRAALSKLHSNLRTKKSYSHSHIDRSSFEKGVSDGKNIHLGKAMGGKKVKQLSS
jgi:hypothetical protein